MFPNSSLLNFNDSNHLAECHKQTQTSSTTVKDSSTSSQPSTADKGSLTIIELNELVQDPEKPGNITIIKDVFSEEIHDHDSDSASERAKSNRYKYCREVIKPYLKDYPVDCPVSDEQIIRDALLAAHQDFPDYQPCFEIYDGDKDITEKKDGIDSGNINKKSKDNSDSSIINTNKKARKSCDPDKNKKSGSSKTSIEDKETKSDLTKKSSIEKGKKCKSKCKGKKSDSDSSIKDTNTNTFNKKSTSKASIHTKESSKSNLSSNMSDDNGCPPKKRNPKCPKKTKRPSIEEEVTGKRRPSPGPPSACKRKAKKDLSTCKNTPSEGSCDSSSQKNKDNPCNRIVKSDSASKQSLTQNADKPKLISDAHSETMAIIKVAVEDFFGKVYQTTKDAVTTIKTESAKQMCSMSSKKSESSDLPPRKVCDENNSKSVGTENFKFFRNMNEIERDRKDTVIGHGLSKTAEMVVGKILNKVDSTISMLSNHVNLEKAASIIKIRSDSNSPFNNLAEATTSNHRPTSVGTSMFTAIKSKIMSMFSENEMQQILPTNSSESANNM
ncbi:unnamed protein product [Diatraea saccharalis]|uniref:Uncharacterized protein n=1 Tax=Diatraea saccharalis TaxID=40085 RepID=A0A9N9RGD0_9NEOP|nr:unnamed protein product [Diatraea saccharalis]